MSRQQQEPELMLWVEPERVEVYLQNGWKLVDPQPRLNKFRRHYYGQAVCLEKA
jgi:hypothetical protein